MDPELLADELAALIREMNKGPYLVFCEALRAAGGSIVIDPGELAQDALRMPPRVEVVVEDGRVVVRLKVS